jgi:hypothetical protein
MEAREAVLAVLREEAAPLHWTKIQDLALRRGYLDPFQTTDVRARVLTALAAAVRDGEVEKREKGVYASAG